jgi:hypothetical protein
MVTVACLCPARADGTPRHPNGDEIQLRERLDFKAATTVRNAVGLARAEDPDLPAAEILATLTEHYIPCRGAAPRRAVSRPSSRLRARRWR